MAISNRDRIGRGFELLAQGLEPFVDEVMTAAASPPGANWVKLLEARDSAKFGATRTYAKTDPQVQLRMITEEWRAGFGDRLSRAEQSIASLLREHRNRWAHNETFSSDDTTHILDLIERLLSATTAKEQASAVRKLRQDHQRAQYDAETRKTVKETHAFTGVAGRDIKPWRQVLRPHDDVSSGRYDTAEFAADLDAVAKGDGTDEYVDPVAFFQRTYLTEGLRDLLKRAAARLAGETASPVINLQTNFGGGKTHSMLALYHLASGRPLRDFPQEVQDLLSGMTLPADIKRVTLVGNRVSAATGVTYRDDRGEVRAKTLWGQLAWQLGGRAAYELVERDDDLGTNPGNNLQELLETHTPCLILIDEWVAYARDLYGKDDRDGGTFDAQFGFAQTLSELVKNTPGVQLVISIPASEKLAGADAELDESEIDDLEVGGLYGREALKRLQKAVGRLAYNWQPATAEESFEIVRRRLFQEADARGRADIAAVARQFVDYYRANSGEFPRDCSEVAYERRIIASYPIHPELFDRLYKDWSTLARFQRTRGVLRVMSTVVHHLWASGDASPLIMPSTLPLDVAPVVGELTYYLDDAWRPIVGRDVDGSGSTPVQIDELRSTFGARSLTRRLARTIFFGSAPTLHTAHKGIERQYVWLGTAVPGDTVGNFGSALDLLAQRATYFYAEAGRYWYDTAQNVTRKAQDHAERLRSEPEIVWDEIKRRLQLQTADRGDFSAVHPAPESTDEVPDYEDARLVLLHPKYAHGKGEQDSAAQQFAVKCLRQRGSAQRINVNQLVFLAPDKRRLAELEDAVRFYLAWKDVAERSGPDDLNLTGQQAKQAGTQRDEYDDTVRLRLATTYMWALLPEQPEADRPYQVSALRADGTEDRLPIRLSKVLNRGEYLITRFGPYPVRMDLDGSLRKLWSERGHIPVGDLWGFYRRYPYLSRLRDRSVLEEAVLSGMDQALWETQAFALAENFDEETGRYIGLAIPPYDVFHNLTDRTLLVFPDRALHQRQIEQHEAEERATATGGRAGEQQNGDEESAPGSSPQPVGGFANPPGGPAPVPQPGPTKIQNARFIGVYSVDPERAGRDFGKLTQEVLQHLQSLPGAEVKITVEIEAMHPDGYPDDKVRTVLENARTLKFDPFRFEDD